jgi:hypothetical protein
VTCLPLLSRSLPMSAICAMACSHASATSLPAMLDAEADAGSATAILEMGAKVVAGTDTYHCRYAALQGSDRFLIGASHTYSSATHHLLVFDTDLPAIPAGQDVERDCFAPDDVMAHARAEIYATQSRTGVFTLPAGVGLPVRAGEVLLLQVHYLNATSADLDATAMLTIATATGGALQSAGAFFFADPFVDVLPGQKGTAAMRCAFPSDVTLLSTAAYAHVHAVDFAAYLDPANGPVATTPFYHAPGYANPLPIHTMIPVAAGSHVRMACAYQNSGGSSELLQGVLNDRDEQCILSGIYYPGLGGDVDTCRGSADEFGTGNATCAQTLACVEACPASSTPPSDLGLGQDGPVDPCWQRCVVASCSDASALLFALLRCQSAACLNECAGDAGTTCTACQQSRCPNEVAACGADSCH